MLQVGKKVNHKLNLLLLQKKTALYSDFNDYKHLITT